MATKSAVSESGKRILVTQIRSQAGRCFKIRRTLSALGLTGIGSSKELPLNVSVMGMINKVESIVTVKAA